MYFGDLGENASTLINYFETTGGRKIEAKENPAEYMLEVIGAGATASSDIEWAGAFKASQVAQNATKDIERIHAEGRNRPAVEGTSSWAAYYILWLRNVILSATLRSEFATSWGYQVMALLRRNAQNYWRDPGYIMAKILLNIAGGLFIGFTFWKADDSQQGTQNKLFVRELFLPLHCDAHPISQSIFMATILR